ncbi:hypothetical protein EVAR_97566_1 [Eumeta japonica]|uniref:Reverse transcriptase domain-containing protein n=1 Tax=Eumeta variegata TaxID=151549 RepID=A0A4C1WPQ6_EUMVA|nr:hypothetical protein EVAR_97566_1 [Eumeta japonica]
MSHGAIPHLPDSRKRHLYVENNNSGEDQSEAENRGRAYNTTASRCSERMWRSCVKNAKCIATASQLKCMQLICANGCAIYKLHQNWCIRRIPEEVEQFFYLINDRSCSCDFFPSLSVSSRKRLSSVLSSNELSEQFDAHSDDTVKGSEDKSMAPYIKMAKETTKRESPKPPTPLRHAGTAASALDEEITTIMSIFQGVKSAEVSDLVAKFGKAKHGVDRLKIILDNQDLINRLYNIYLSMRPISAAVPQGLTLSPLLYSAYVNDIPRASTGVQLV